MPQKTRHERMEIATARLLRVLRNHGVASMRTLEMKISDAGPGPMRINPHILTAAREVLTRAGRIQKVNIGNGNWFHLSDTPSAIVEARLAEMRPIQAAYSRQNFNLRLGQSLEIATFRALAATDYDFLGRYVDLGAHHDGTLYSKEEPANYLSANRAIPDDRRLDFLMRVDSTWAGIECKNIREWIYPDRREVRELLDKCRYMDCVPVLIARRIHPATFFVLNKCGVIIHQTYNQLLPEAEVALATQAKDKRLLGYADIRLGNQPDARLSRFVAENLPSLLPQMRPRWAHFRDLVQQYCLGNYSYAEFAARVRRRTNGQNEDNDWEESEPSDFDDEG